MKTSKKILKSAVKYALDHQ